MPFEVVPFEHWSNWWRINRHATSLAAGAVAGMTAEAVLFPLDCFKTRVQSQQGFQAAGGFRGAYRGFGIAIAGSAPASAIFFTTYEFSKHHLTNYNTDISGGPRGFIGGCLAVSIASMIGEVSACIVRVPVDLSKQRLQVGQSKNFTEAFHSVRNCHRAIVFGSFRATALRDISHSSLQYPLYEMLKGMVASRAGCRDSEYLPTHQAAMCGSVAGAISATLTTPLDLLKTRLNLRSAPRDGEGGGALILEEARHIYNKNGVQGFFCGAVFRSIWMGIGGFVFLGSFEFAKDHLTSRSALLEREGQRPPLAKPSVTSQREAPPQHQLLGEQPPALLSFAAGLVAGICVDVPLHPVDTIKTRLQGPGGLHRNGGFTGLWNGLSAVLLTSVPGSAIFFVIYERVRYALSHHASSIHEITRDAVAASFADVCACSVRVPCEVLKQRMQISGAKKASLMDTFIGISAEGVRGFYAGLGAMITREVPFALVQMPLFEEFKRRHPLASPAQQDAKIQGLIGMSCGCLAGAFAGFATTPVDSTKTRIMLTENRANRSGVFSTMVSVGRESGLRGLFSGVVPRTLHCAIGGALWLGSFDFCNRFLKDYSSINGA